MIRIDRKHVCQLLTANLLTALIILCVAVATLIVILLQGSGS